MIQAHIAEGPFGDSLKVFIIEHANAGKRLLRTESGGSYRWEELVEGAAVSDPHPTYVLPWDTGRSLLESLVRHYQGAEDTRQLRKDYDSERGRVDMLTNSLVDIARASAERGFRS